MNHVLLPQLIIISFMAHKNCIGFEVHLVKTFVNCSQYPQYGYLKIEKLIHLDHLRVPCNRNLCIDVHNGQEKQKANKIGVINGDAGNVPYDVCISIPEQRGSHIGRWFTLGSGFTPFVTAGFVCILFCHIYIYIWFCCNLL